MTHLLSNREVPHLPRRSSMCHQVDMHSLTSHSADGLLVQGTTPLVSPASSDASQNTYPYAHITAVCASSHSCVLFADKPDDGASAAAASAADSGEEEDAEASQQAGSAGREAADKTPVGVFQSALDRVYVT